MTEWTSISVTEEQKEYIQDSKPEGMAMGAFLKNEISMANDPAVEVDTERIIGRLDDLQNQLPKDVAEELSR